MPGKQIDKLRKEKYKASRLQGNSIAQGLRDSGYSEATAHKSSVNGVVKVCEPELQAMVKCSDITVEWVVNRLTQELGAIDCKASDRIRIAELLGRYLNMFRDNVTAQGVTINITDTLDKLKTSKPIDITT